VGPSGDFATLQIALSDDRVVDGMTIFVEAGTYEYSSAPIAIDKSLTICGASRLGTILNRTDYGVAVLVTAHNVSLVDMTVSQGPALAYPELGTELFYRAFSGTIMVGYANRVDNVLLENVAVHFEIVGIVLEAKDFRFFRTSLVQTQSFFTGTGMVLEAIRGNCRIDYVDYESSGEVPNNMFNLKGYHENRGSLTITNSRNIGRIGVFFLQDSFVGSPGALTLSFVDNRISNADYFVKMSIGTRFRGNGDVLNRIEALGNRFDDHQGCGLITIDAYEGFRSRDLPLVARGNHLPPNGPDSGFFPEVNGSVGSLCRYYVGNQLGSFTVSLVE